MGMQTTFFPKDLAYRFSTLLVVAGCYNEIRDNGCKCNTSFSKTDKYLTFFKKSLTEVKLNYKYMR
jgi:hypothetical protein